MRPHLPPERGVANLETVQFGRLSTLLTLLLLRLGLGTPNFYTITLIVESRRITSKRFYDYFMVISFYDFSEKFEGFYTSRRNASFTVRSAERGSKF